MSVWIDGSKSCECVHCKNNIGFGLPLELIESIKKGKLVIFAGAGVSTESKKVYNYSFYDEIKLELGLEKDCNYSFSKLMSLYCEKKGRRELLLKIRNRIDYVYSFPELYRKAADFHKELATIEPIKEIVTTNWDDLFETECGAIPIVNSEDFAFWCIFRPE